MNSVLLNYVVHIASDHFWPCGPFMATYNKYNLLITKLSCIINPYRGNFLCYKKPLVRFSPLGVKYCYFI